MVFIDKWSIKQVLMFMGFVRVCIDTVGLVGIGLNRVMVIGERKQV